MEAMAFYLMAYLFGVATPIFFVRQLLRYFVPGSSPEGYLLDLLSLVIFFLIGALCYVWLSA